MNGTLYTGVSLLSRRGKAFARIPEETDVYIIIQYCKHGRTAAECGVLWIPKEQSLF